MKIIRAKDYADMSRKAANIISAQVIMKPNCVLGLATGGTPVGAYQQLVEWYNKGDIDFSEVTTVNLDEYRGLPKDHPESYWSFMHRHLFDHININPARINLPDGTNPDADAACAQYNQIIHTSLNCCRSYFVNRINKRLEVVCKLFFSKACFTYWHMDNVCLIKSVLDLTSFDFLDSFCNVHCYCTSLRVWH